MAHYLSDQQLDSRPLVVVGAGTLGRRIGLMQATAGVEVRLVDTSQTVLESAKAFIEAELPALVPPGGMRPANLTFTRDLPTAVTDAWLITEAVPEKIELKRDILSDLDRLAPPDAILASNSSSYPTSQLVERVTRRNRVVNTHYYWPPRVNVVEVMSCGETDPAVIDVLLQRFPKYGLLPFRLERESVGFIFNRIWAAIKRESLAVVAEGVATPQQVDEIFSLVLGVPSGPFRLMDGVGLDVVLDIEEHYAALPAKDQAEPRRLLRQYVENGYLGTKTGQGFYKYES